MQTIPVTDAPVVEIISAYAASNQQLPAVEEPPAWVIIGGFYMPRTATIRLEVIGVVSDGSVALTVRLFDVAGAAPVTGSTTAPIDGTTDERQLSGAFELTGGKVYQVQAQCIGGEDEFGIIRTATLISS